MYQNPYQAKQNKIVNISENIYYINQNNLPPVIEEKAREPKPIKEKVTFLDAFEVLAEKELNFQINNNSGICRCKKCREDIITVSLRDLPALFISDTDNQDTICKIEGQYMQSVVRAVTSAIAIVSGKANCNGNYKFKWNPYNDLEMKWANQ